MKATQTPTVVCEENREVQFRNTPLSVEEEKIMDCQYGHHYFFKKQAFLSTSACTVQQPTPSFL